MCEWPLLQKRMLGVTKPGSFSGIYAPHLAAYSHLIRQKTHDCQEHLTPRIYDPANATNLVWKRAGYICFLWPWEWTWIYKLSAAGWSSSHKQTKIRPPFFSCQTWSMADILNREIAFTEMTVDIVYRICWPKPWEYAWASCGQLRIFNPMHKLLRVALVGLSNEDPYVIGMKLAWDWWTGP